MQGMILPDLVRGPIKQICFIVPDPLAAARDHNRLYGSGPFFVHEHYSSTRNFHRGQEIDEQLDLSSACGQFGNVLLEFTTQHNDAPSAYHDIMPTRGPGIHHFAFFVDDAKAEVARFAKAGFELATYFEIDSSGCGYSFFDTTKAFGIMTEVYEESYLGPFYKFCEDEARDWDGRNPLRGIEDAAAALGVIAESIPE